MYDPLDKIKELETQVAEMRQGYYKIRAAVKWDMKEGVWKDGREPFARGYIEGVCASHLFMDDKRSTPEQKDNYIMQLFIAEATLHNAIGMACIQLNGYEDLNVKKAKEGLLEALRTVPVPQRPPSPAKQNPQDTSTTALRNLKDLLQSGDEGAVPSIGLSYNDSTDEFYLSSGSRVVAHSPTLEDCISVAAAKELGPE